jgi:outer membrane protein assembly factor BamE (lipoprotein component of BamABCDE complex)
MKLRILAALLICLIVLSTIDASRARSALHRANKVKIGDTRQQVRNTLGRPCDITVASLFDGSETWAYGGYVNWGHLLSCPLRIRLFGPDDELAVQFDTSGKVSRILLPPGKK